MQAAPEVSSVSPPEIWWSEGQSVTVTVYGQGFWAHPPWACQGADSDTISASSDTQAGGTVQVSESATSVTICAGEVSYGPIDVGPASGPNPTPSFTVTSDPSPPWQAGSTYAFSLDGTGFGTNPHVIITGPDNTTYYNDWCSGTGCDTHFAGWVTIPSNAPTGDATVQLVSHGYTGNGFFGNPGQLDSSADQVPVQAAGGCGDQRDTIIAQYSTYGATLRPGCGDFTSDGHSEHFSFNALKSPDADWAILNINLLDGLEVTRMTEGGSPITINRGYSTPLHNYQVPGGTTPNSWHIYGDAADMATGSVQATWDVLHEAAKAALACVEPQDLSGVGHVHADWRGWCPSRW